MPEPIISISGLRGVIGTEFSPLVAIRFSAAFCSQLGPGPVVIARDGRSSGPMLADAISAAITAAGRDCIDLDVASTPTVGVFVKQSQAAGAIQISASHNPPQYNGMKLFGPDGRVLPHGPGARVLDAYRGGESTWSSVEQIGRRNRVSDPHASHFDAVLATVDVTAIRKRHFRVLLDSNHGAGSILGQRLLAALGCETTVLGETPDGQFEHAPEPIAENLRSVATHLTNSKLDVGFCQDPDADRLAIIDENGSYIGEEFTSVLCMKRRLMTHRGPLVTNCASSSMTAWLASEHGVPFVRSKVGEANVVDAMLACGAVYGGEGSGGPIDPRVGLIRDSFVGIAQVLDLMVATNSTISELVTTLPKLSMIKDKMTIDRATLLTAIDAIATKLQAVSINHEDGVRLDWADRWLLLRASNTEPIVRLIAESPSEQESRALIASAKKIVADAE